MHRRLAIHTSHGIALLFLLLLLSACTGGGAPVQAPTLAPNAVIVPRMAAVAPPAEPAVIPTQIATETVGDQPLLEWEGLVQVGNDAQKCRTMRVSADYALTIGFCGQSPSTATMIRQEMVREMFARLAPFEYRTGEDKLVFRGRGEIADPIWGEAVLAWVHNSYGELSSGHVCASCSTVFTWSLGQVAGQAETCRIVYVLAWGYATATEVPCKGGISTPGHSDWLTTGEWQALNDLTNRGAVNPDTVDWDKGSKVPGNERLTGLLDDWTRGVYERLSH